MVLEGLSKISKVSRVHSLDTMNALISSSGLYYIYIYIYIIDISVWTKGGLTAQQRDQRCHCNTALMHELLLLEEQALKKSHKEATQRRTVHSNYCNQRNNHITWHLSTYSFPHYFSSLANPTIFDLCFTLLASIGFLI